METSAPAIATPSQITAPIDPKKHVAPGTGFCLFLGWTLAIFLAPLIILGTILATYGIALILWMIAGIWYFSRQRKAKALLRGSALRADSRQFPEIYEAARRMSSRLGLQECPEIYIIEDNQQNAFALKIGSKRCVVLIDDVIYGALATGNEKALEFIIGHELAHHALGHTHLMRSMISSKYLRLSRLDEFSCDAVAHALIADPEAARAALALLLVGPQLFQRVDLAALEQQVDEVLTDRYSKKAEVTLAHPLLLRRYGRITRLALK